MMTSRWPALAMFVFASGLSASCSGQVAGGPAGPSRSSRGARPDDAGSAPPIVVRCEGDCVSQSPIAAITHEEYAAAVSDVLGIANADVAGLPPDGAVDPFASNALIPRGDAAPAYEAVAARLAEQFVTTRIEACREPSCISAFVAERGARLYRRPLETAEREALASLYAIGAEGSTHANGVRLVIEALLQSPNFIYRVERAPGDRSSPIRALSGYEVAGRLAAFLWRSAPDAALLESAASGLLDTPEGVRAAAARMLDDPRSDRGIASFHSAWLGAQALHGSSLEPSVEAAMHEELDRYVVAILRSDEPTLERLFTVPEAPINAELAAHYGVRPPRSEWDQVSVPGRAGVLGRGAVLAANGGSGPTRIIHRGLLVRRRLLCDTIAGPDGNPALTDLVRERLVSFVRDPSWSDRQYIAGLTQSPGTVCAGCHYGINPPGYAFEGFDYAGRSIPGADASGDLNGTPVADLESLGRLLGVDPRVEECAVAHWMTFALGRPAQADDVRAQQAVTGLVREASRSGLDLRELILGIVTSDAFRLRRFESTM